MNDYSGRHASSQPWAIASHSSGRGRHQVRNRRRRRLAILGVVVLLLLLAYPFAEARFPRTEKVLLRAEDLSADANHLHIVFVSDIHYGFWFSDTDLNNLINTINSLKPDIVLFGGGYGADNLSALTFFRKLPGIHARYAIYGVVGDSDRGETDYELEHLTDAMRNAGVIPLVNEVATVRVGNASLRIAGLDDPVRGSPDIKGVSAKVSAEEYVVLLAHSPSVVPDAHLATDQNGRIGWFDLGLFGHTHGGQMLFFSDWLGFGDDVPDRYRSGWLTENRANILVSRGVGTKTIPARLFCSPQIHLIELTTN